MFLFPGDHMLLLGLRPKLYFLHRRISKDLLDINFIARVDVCLLSLLITMHAEGRRVVANPKKWLLLWHAVYVT